MDYTKLSEELVSCIHENLRNNNCNNIGKLSEGELKLMYLLSVPLVNGAYSGDLAASAGLTTGRVAIILNGLNKKGYVSRHHDKTDKRKVFIKATETGKMATLQIYNDVITRASAVLSQLGDKDAPEFVRLVKRILTETPQL